jgi:squalene-hopene/tetraprenyl-beta-curcumene cyclase
MTDTTLNAPSAALDKLDPALERHIRAATDAILADQQPDGHWVFELEADATIPAEYVLMVHYFAETPNLELERKIGVYLRRIQGAHGGWPLFHEGAFDMSASVKAYFALKMIGDDINAGHMKRAREAILSRGGGV